MPTFHFNQLRGYVRFLETWDFRQLPLSQDDAEGMEKISLLFVAAKEIIGLELPLEGKKGGTGNYLC